MLTKYACTCTLSAIRIYRYIGCAKYELPIKLPKQNISADSIDSAMFEHYLQ
jgi:hypothetical protein